MKQDQLDFCSFQFVCIKQTRFGSEDHSIKFDINKVTLEVKMEISLRILQNVFNPYH